MKKHLYLFALVSFLYLGCRKDKVIYKPFTETELEFVSYTSGRGFKIIDSNGVTRTLEQSKYRREFSEYGRSWFGNKDFLEKYEVGFNSYEDSQVIDIRLFLYGEFLPYTQGQVVVHVNEYRSHDVASKLNPPTDNMMINAINYQNVYRLIAYKNGTQVNNNDTAIIYWNKQFGFIQFLLPGGKAFTRTD